jgi:hypothetical protein
MVSDPMADSVPARDAAGDQRTRDAIDLGWRLAALYDEAERLSPARCERRVGTYLPAVDGLSDNDRFELYVRAAASVAQRLGADARAHDVEALLDTAQAVFEERESIQALRAGLYECHTALTKELWAGCEADGKAFELGTSLFDTWHRVADKDGNEAKNAAWKDTFGRERVARVKLLLDDLESRLSSVAVAVVRAHLVRWEWAIAQRPRKQGAPSTKAEQHLHSQVLTWRQLLTEDKAPEAFLTCGYRRRLHHEFSWLVWRSFLRPAPILCILLIAGIAAALMFGGPKVTDAASLLVAPLGAIGLSKASLNVLARDRMHVWTMLLWNRAMATVLFKATCFADVVLPQPRRGASLNHVKRLAATVTRPLPMHTVVAPEPLPAPEL